MNELIINKNKEKSSIEIGVLEENNISEIYVYEGKKESIIGNIYCGIVQNVVDGMQAAFVDIGIEKNTFISIKDALPKVDVAKEELEALKEKDEEKRKAIAEQAEQAERDAIEQEEKYWKGVKEVIDSRNIAGYKIPDTIIINKDGKKISVTPDDFFKYIYQIDKNGKSRYQYDLENETPEARRNDSILRAYLKFVGGSYSNLVDMAINDKEVKKLKLIAKTRNTTGIKITKPNSDKNNGKIDFGY